jgi:hypothetical protein
LGNFPWTALACLGHHVGKPEMTPGDFVGDLTRFGDTNFCFAHGTTPKTTQMQPANPTAQRAEETKTTSSTPTIEVPFKYPQCG